MNTTKIIKKTIQSDLRQNLINCMTPDRGYSEFSETIKLFKKLEQEKQEAIDVLKLIIDDLPKNRDWLDPDVEKVAKILIKNNEDKNE